MKIQQIQFNTIPQISKTDKAYTTGDSTLDKFYAFKPEFSEFSKVIPKRFAQKVNREILVEVLKDQYSALKTNHPVKQNIEALLSDSTFTITTAHQPSLFTGPLYFIYKIASTINLTRKLNETHNSFDFVPVFIIGGEDHDFDEINHFNLFGKTIEWNDNKGGAVGDYSNQQLQSSVLDELIPILGKSEHAEALIELFKSSYTNDRSYGEATQFLVNELFGKYGLVILNPSDKRLKQLAIPYFKQELIEQVSEPIVTSTIKELNELGYKNQAFPRNINLFYLLDGSRERIVLEGSVYKVLNTDLSFSRDAILTELNNHPERFSPNVVLRPIYQEVILPNLAYIGGGGELAYWLERKAQFEKLGVFFPMLIRRNSALWINLGQQKKLNKLGLTAEQLFKDADTIIKEYVDNNSTEALNFEAELQLMDQLYEQAYKKAEKVDPTLGKAVLAEQARQTKALNQLESRLMRSEKQKHETAINQIHKLKDQLFPSNGLQERHDNFAPFYLKHGARFIDVLVENLYPLDKQFTVLTEELTK